MNGYVSAIDNLRAIGLPVTCEGGGKASVWIGGQRIELEPPEALVAFAEGVCTMHAMLVRTNRDAVIRRLVTSGYYVAVLTLEHGWHVYGPSCPSTRAAARKELKERRARPGVLNAYMITPSDMRKVAQRDEEECARWLAQKREEEMQKAKQRSATHERK